MYCILALLPPKAAVICYIQAAQLLFSPVSDGFLLSAESFPHIPICQFECGCREEAIEIWREFSSLTCHVLPVCFTGLSFIRGKGTHAGFYWAELSVARREEILRVHRLALDLLASRGLGCCNDIGECFRPHLTLARICRPEALRGWSERLFENPGPFRLALGIADENGQYLHTLCEGRHFE